VGSKGSSTVVFNDLSNGINGKEEAAWAFFFFFVPYPEGPIIYNRVLAWNVERWWR
jgi:hypothetical protein